MGSDSAVPFAMVGAGGRMGRSIIALSTEQHIDAQPWLRLAGAAERSGSEWIGKDAGTMAGVSELGVAVTDDLAVALENARAVIDFSAPETTLRLAELCADRGIALIVGTTGFTPEQRAALSGFADRIALLVSPNMSVGVNLLFHLTEVAAKAVPGFETEVTEIHHHHKKDAPSGTAQRLKEVLLESLGRSEEDVVYGREGIGDPRPAQEIGVHALRGGDVVGEHTVFYFGDGERLELVHRATSRKIFAAGALRSAAFLAGRPAGEYSMKDVLGIGSTP